MTDFLSKLVARTLDIAPTAQPIIAPLYALEPTMPDLSMRPGETTSKRALTSPTLLDAQDLGKAGQNESRRPAIAGQQMPYTEPTVAQRLSSAASNPSHLEEVSTTETPDRLAPANRPVIHQSNEPSLDELQPNEPRTRRSGTPLADQFQPNGPSGLIQPSEPGKPSATGSRSTQSWVENQPASSDTALPQRQATISATPLRPDKQATQVLTRDKIERNQAVDAPLVAPHLSSPRAAPQTREAQMFSEPGEPQRLATAEPAISEATKANVSAAEVRRPQLHEAFKQREATTPTIQVTIGRIEVRAIQPMPAVQPRPAAKPAVSLEDYLRAQQGGR